MSHTGGNGEVPSQAGGNGPQHSELVQYEYNNAWVILVSGAWDMNSITPLAEAMESAARKYAVLVMDASALTFADSSFLNLLLRIHHSGPATLRVAGPSPQLQRLLEITGADTVLDVRATVHDATLS
ncbi:STAS domain-containing protein [Streptomyces sp. NPDC086549]|uniref:STAS domain-containing protein n=1 Tax=Streptomyces sp. NPDC086549 TaxID=3365752 RepID=UPI0037FBA0EF